MKIELRHYDVLGSTNETAAEAAASGGREGLVIVASRQTGGHGRMDRVWSSPAGGLWFTILLRPRVEPRHVAELTLLAGVAAARALRILYESDDIRIKWPNDILLGAKKVAGILSEMRLTERGDIDYAIIGAGVNVSLPDDALTGELREKAASLNDSFGTNLSTDEVLRAILAEFIPLYESWQDRGAEVILPEWRALSCTLGNMVAVLDDDRVIYEGLAVSIDGSGRLAVRASDGSERRFDFGEISIRPKGEAGETDS